MKVFELIKQIKDKAYDESEMMTRQKQCIVTGGDPWDVKHTTKISGQKKTTIWTPNDQETKICRYTENCYVYVQHDKKYAGMQITFEVMTGVNKLELHC